MQIDKRILGALVQFAATERSRYALHGVRFDRTRSGEARVVATDGKRLAVVKPVEVKRYVAEGGDTLGSPVIVERDAVEVGAKLGGRLRWKDADKRVVCVREDTNPNGSVTFVTPDGDAALKAETVEGNFPDFDQVIPERNAEGATVIGLDARYLRDLCDLVLAHPWGDDNPIIRFTIQGPGDAVRADVKVEGPGGAETVAVIMPAMLKD